MPRLRLLLLTLVLCTPVSWQPTAAFAQSPADVAAARDLYIEGAQLTKQKNWAAAEDRLSRSLELKRAPITHYSLGVVQQELGKLVEALENFRAFLAAPHEEATAPLREHAEKFVQQLSPRVARVRILIEPQEVPELAVTVDDVPVPRAALDQPRLVNPGKHVVKARAEGYEPKQMGLTVREGALAEARLLLRPAPADVSKTKHDPSPPPSPGQDELARSEPFPVGPVVLLAAGAASLGVGLAVGWVGVGEAEDAPASDGPEADAALTKTIAGDVVAGVGISVALVGIVWLIVDASGDDDSGDHPTAARGWSRGGLSGFTLSF